jgi:hypothetical protein
MCLNKSTIQYISAYDRFTFSHFHIFTFSHFHIVTLSHRESGGLRYHLAIELAQGGDVSALLLACKQRRMKMSANEIAGCV